MVVERSIHHLVNKKWNNTLVVLVLGYGYINTCQVSVVPQTLVSLIVFTLSFFFFHFLIQIMPFLPLNMKQYASTQTKHVFSLCLIATLKSEDGECRGLIAIWLKRKQNGALSWGELHSLLWFNYSANQSQTSLWTEKVRLFSTPCLNFTQINRYYPLFWCFSITAQSLMSCQFRGKKICHWPSPIHCSPLSL